MIRSNRVSAVSRIRVAATVLGHQSKPDLPTAEKEFTLR